MVERRPGKRDLPRLVAWSVTGVIGITLGIAGVVYEPRADLGVLLGSASFALQIGAVDFAREQLAMCVEEVPDDADVRLLQARLAFLDGDRAAAESHLDVVLAGEPDNGEAHLYYGFSKFETGDFAASLRHYEIGGPLLERTGRRDLVTDYRIRLAELLIGAGRFAEAEALAKQLVADGTRPAAGELIFAFSRLGQGDDTAFGQALGRAYSSDPLDPLFRQGPGPLARVFPWLPAP